MPAAWLEGAGTALQDGCGGKASTRVICGAFMLSALSVGGSPAIAQGLPQISAQASAGTAEVLGSRSTRASLAVKPSKASAAAPQGAQLTIVRPDVAASLSIETGVLTGEVSLAGAVDGAEVIASRTTDIVGRPIDIFRPIGARSNLSISFPSRMPVAARAVTSGFGWRTHPILGGRRAHSGVDLAAPYGSPVVATADGIVGQANWRGGYGLFVAVENGGVETRYAHMSRLNVVAGQRVRQGDVIGYVGSTGRSTGPHLHYEVRVNGQAVDPMRARAK